MGKAERLEKDEDEDVLLRALAVPRAGHKWCPRPERGTRPNPSPVPLCLQQWLSRSHTQGPAQLLQLREHSGHVCGMDTVQPLRWLGDLVLRIAVRHSRPAAFPLRSRAASSSPRRLRANLGHCRSRAQVSPACLDIGSKHGQWCPENHRTLEASGPRRVTLRTGDTVGFKP